MKSHGGYTAWSDKHPAYDFYNGPSGKGVDDFYSPEINSKVIPLPSVTGCGTIPDPQADLTAWTNSFQNIRCYDALKTNVILNEVSGKNHDGTRRVRVPMLFGMNFQAVSVGQKLVENGVSGGYTDSTGTPSGALLDEITFVDKSIGSMVTALKEKGIFESTVIVVTAKHGQSPIDPAKILRVPADNSAMRSPADVLGNSVAAASEDDISLIWLTDQSKTAQAVSLLSQNQEEIGAGEIYSGPSLKLMFDDPITDPRTPDIAVQPNTGVIYTGGKKKIAEHGGFAPDDTNVMLLVSNAGYSTGVIATPVQTTQVAPTILKMLGMNPSELEAVAKDKTRILPGLKLSDERRRD